MAAALWWRLVLIVVVGGWTYSNTLSNPFIFDDVWAITMNGTIRNVRNLPAVLSPPHEFPVAGRPLVNLTFAINYALGELDVRGYHVVNIALHLSCALLLFGLTRRTLELPAVQAAVGHRASTLAFAAVLLWTVHPLNSEVVDYVTERTESMMALFYLLALYASRRAVVARRSGIWIAIAVLASASGMACKESMVTLPLVVVLYDRVFLFDSFRRAIRARWPLYGGLAASWLLLAALMADHPRTLSSGFATTDASVWTYLLNQAVMVTRYLRLAIWPSSLVLYYGWSRPLTMGDIWPQALFVTLLVVVTIVGLIRQPRLGFLAAWAFITLAPTSSLVPIGAEVGAERRMYLPLAGLITLGVIGAVLIADRMARRLDGRVAISSRAWSATGTLVLILTSAALATVTRARNQEYAAGLTMARTVLARWPTPAAHHMVGTELTKAGRHEEAIEHLRESTRGYPPAAYALGLELFGQGRPDEAIEHLQAFIRDEPGSSSVRPARIIMGDAFERTGRRPQAIEQFERVLAAYPSDIEAHGRLAEALAKQRAYAQAIAHYRAFLDSRVADANAWNGLGVALAATGHADDAIAALRRAVGFDPREGRFRVSLASALLAHGDLDGGTHQAGEAVRLMPEDPRAHDVRGRAHEYQGNLEAARREYRRALELDPADPVALEDLRRLSPKRRP
jgi:protein O-mannosyl-transferase